MSEQTTSFMASLDAWSDRSIIEPLADAYLKGPEEVIISAQEYARKAIRAKVLESYRNGQAAALEKVYKRPQRPFLRRTQRRPFAKTRWH